MKEDNGYLALLGCFGLAVYIPVTIAVSSILEGWVLVKLWNWFVLPLFESAPNLTIPYAIGISLLVALMTHQINRNSNSDSDDKESAAIRLLSYFVEVVSRPIFVLITAWIVTLFV